MPDLDYDYAMVNDNGSVTAMKDLQNGSMEMNNYVSGHEDFQFVWNLAQISPPPTTPAVEMTQEQKNAIDQRNYEIKVNEERDKRIVNNFWFETNHFQFDANSKANIAGASTLAGFAVLAQPIPGFYRWHGGPSDFGWITWNNTFIPMDANTCFDFGKAALGHESSHIFAARALKSQAPRSDYQDDSLWP